MNERIDEMTKDEIVKVIVETSQAVAFGYQQTHCAHCTDGRTAASNTGYFILKALGYSHDEIVQLNASATADSPKGVNPKDGSEP